MATARHLAHAPIREALIDILFDPPIELERIATYTERMAGEFPSGKDIFETTIGVGEEGTGITARTTKLAIGKRLDSKVHPHVIMCRVNGFTFSRLEPYVDWTQIREQAARCWSVFLEVASPRTVTRLAVRYINVMPFPMPIVDFEDYLTCPPRVPDGLPQGLSSFVQRTVIPDAAANCVSVVTQALEEPAAARGEVSTVTVFLDIDTFRQVQMSANC